MTKYLPLQIPSGWTNREVIPCVLAQIHYFGDIEPVAVIDRLAVFLAVPAVMKPAVDHSAQSLFAVLQPYRAGEPSRQFFFADSLHFFRTKTGF